jgi:hypothetical protein
MLLHQARAAAKEVDQVAVAASVVGIAYAKAGELTRLASAVGDGLKGDRPEVQRVRLAIIQRIHDVRTVAGAKMPLAVRGLSDALFDAVALLKRGLGDGVEEWKVGSWTIANTYGYTDAEMRTLLGYIKQLASAMDKAGIKLPDVGFALDPTWTLGPLAIYDPQWETVAMDPDGHGDFSTLASAVGRNLWDGLFTRIDREAWSSVGDFVSAFATMMAGDTLSADEAARLTVSLAKYASSWPERLAR